MTEEEGDESAPVELPIDGVLDLHTFAPRDVRKLVADYVDECAARGLDEIRVIHGKGSGTLRRIVHSVLERHRCVVAFRAGELAEGGWGATVAQLRPPRR